MIKAFNTVFAQIYADGPKFGGQAVQVFCASDDKSARTTVANIISDAGFEPVDVGSLKNARHLEAIAALNIQLGYGLGRGTQIAPVWIERSAI